MEIPVYGLSGIDGAATRAAAKRDGKPFKQFADKIKNPAVKNMMVAKHRKKVAALEGIYNFNAAKVKSGNATKQDRAELRKAKILLTLEATDYDAFRLASIYMPYVVDIDESDGGYYFVSPEVAQIAAAGEEEFMAYLNSPAPTELGKIKLFKKIGKAIGNAAKATVKAVATTAKTVAKATTAAVKATGNALKATANVVKAGAQAVTGNTSGAKDSIKKAAQQVISSVKDPIKTAVSNTKDIVKDTIVEPTKTAIKDAIDITKATIQIAGKVFKVLFIKINPLTVMIRSSLRGLMALNFCGMATRLNVGLMTQAEAEAEGYSVENWNKAKKAVEKFKKLFKKMGGNEDKLINSIKNGSKRKPLFKKDINKDTKVNFANGDDGETTLGEPATVIAMIGACVGILAQIWSWISSIVANKKAEKAQQQAQQQAQQEAQQQLALQQAAEAEAQRQAQEQQLALQQAAEAEAMAIAQTEAEAEAQKNERNKKIMELALIGGTVLGVGCLLSD